MNLATPCMSRWHRIQTHGQRLLVLAVLALLALFAAGVLPAATGLSHAAGLHSTQQREVAQAETPIIRD